MLATVSHRKIATATRRHVQQNNEETKQVKSMTELKSVLDKMSPDGLIKDFTQKEQETLENIIKDGELFSMKGRGYLKGKVSGFTGSNSPLKETPVCVSVAPEEIEKWLGKLRIAPKNAEIATQEPEILEKPYAVNEEEAKSKTPEEVNSTEEIKTEPAQTKKEKTVKDTEESYQKDMKDAYDKGSIPMPVLQEVVRKRRESADKMKTSESKEGEVETKKKKTENLDTTDYKRKFLNASKHCREAQEEMKLAVNKAERFEKKAKRTDELERKMKEMEKEMQRMNRKLFAQAQQAEEIERLKAKISKKETVEKQLRVEKKDLIQKNQSLQLELYKLKAGSPNSSTPQTTVVRHNLDELQKMKDDFPRDELMNEMRQMTEKVLTISNSSANVKEAEYELCRMEKTINIYLDSLEINIQKIKKTHDNSDLLPLPRVPCFSEKFLRIYFDEIDKIPSDAAQGIPDTDCLICHVFRDSDEKTIECATCNKVYHLDCAQQWFKTKRTCPHCCEWFKPTKESMVNIDNCWKL